MFTGKSLQVGSDRWARAVVGLNTVREGRVGVEEQSSCASLNGGWLTGSVTVEVLLVTRRALGE